MSKRAVKAPAGQGVPAGRRMPIQTLPPFDLGNLTETATDDEARAYYRQWAGWEVTYRSDLNMTIFGELASKSTARIVKALSLVVTGWNFVDENGEPLPQPNRDNFTKLGLSDELISLLMVGYAEALKAPKATAKPS